MKKIWLIIFISLLSAGIIWAGTSDTLFPSAILTDQLPVYRPTLGIPSSSSSYGRITITSLLALFTESDPDFNASPARLYKESASGFVLNGGYTVIETKLHGAITVTNFYLALNEDPTTEIDVVVYYRTAGVGEGSLNEIYSGTTVNGVLDVSSGWNTNIIPSDSEIVYFTNTEPDATTYFQKASIVGTYN